MSGLPDQHKLHITHSVAEWGSLLGGESISPPKTHKEAEGQSPPPLCVKFFAGYCTENVMLLLETA